MIILLRDEHEGVEDQHQEPVGHAVESLKERRDDALTINESSVSVLNHDVSEDQGEDGKEEEVWEVEEHDCSEYEACISQCFRIFRFSCENCYDGGCRHWNKNSWSIAFNMVALFFSFNLPLAVKNIAVDLLKTVP